MVATVLRLRYRILGNTLRRSPWQLVGFIFGLLWALWILGTVGVGLGALAIFQGLDVARSVAVGGGSLLILGWLVGPLLVSGMDTSVDAAKLAPFPLSRRDVMRALTATGLTGIPGIVTTLAALATVVLWLRWPVAAVVAVPCVALAVLTCVLASRLMGAVSDSSSGASRAQQIGGTVLLVVLIFSGPIVTGVLTVARGTLDLGERLTQVTQILAWTPLGASWAVPGDVAAGSWGLAAARLGIAVATPLVLWWAWDRALRTAVRAPRRRATRTAKAGALGWFGRLPTGAVGATFARALTSWFKDPRYSRQLLTVPLLPILFAFVAGVDSPLFAASAVLTALILAIVGYTDISYDGTAFALILSAGVRGRADRLGRVLGAACIGVPLLLIISIITTTLSGNTAMLPPILGLSFAILFVGYGVSAVSSALIVSPVPAAGDNVFKSVPGQTFVNSMLVFVVWGASIVLSVPAAIPAIISFVTGNEVLGWIVLGGGIVYGVAIVVVGVLVGGRTLERTGPDLLTRMKAFPR